MDRASPAQLLWGPAAWLLTLGGTHGLLPTGGSLLRCPDQDREQELPPPWPRGARAVKRRMMLCWQSGYGQLLPVPKAPKPLRLLSEGSPGRAGTEPSRGTGRERSQETQN